MLWSILLVAQNASFSLRWNDWSAGVQSRCFCLQTPSKNTNHSLTKLTNTLLLHAQPHSVCARVFAFDLSVRLCVCVCIVFERVSWDSNSLEGMLQLEQKYKTKWDHRTVCWLAVETTASSKASSCLILNLQTIGSAERYNRMPKWERQRIRIDVLCLDIVTGLQKHEAGGITSPVLKSVKKYIFPSRRAQIASQTNWSLHPVPVDWSVSQALRTQHGLLRSDLLFTGVACQCLPWTLD